ncbi:MAG TPA: hypothetical protein VGF39_06210 [Stellaceae bacterium]|jgi:hypothetical protein
MKILEEFRSFKPGTKARAIAYLRFGILDGDAPPNIQVLLDRWTRRVEAHGPGGRGRGLHALENAGAL